VVHLRVHRVMSEFTCNLCGKLCHEPTCPSCGSGVRDRAILQVLSRELFAADLTVPEFPRLKSLRGIGISDSHLYADRLAAKFDYRNTFFDREPRLDIANPPQEESGKYDFVISSEVFEHVLPPVENAFRGAARLLKPNGVLVLTTPYSLEPSTAEHYPDLHEFGLAQTGDRLVLVNRTRSGDLQVFDNPVFHLACSGKALEVREFSENALRGLLAGVGFTTVRIHSENCAPFGIVRTESWSLPISARMGAFSLGYDSAREIMEHWRELNRSVQRLGATWWFRIGRRIGLV
jgi:SAM-dependent methyltransferase